MDDYKTVLGLIVLIMAIASGYLNHLSVRRAKKKIYDSLFQDEDEKGDVRTETIKPRQANEELDKKINQALLQHFNKSLTSKCILESLSETTGTYYRYDDLIKRINDSLMRRKRNPLPDTAFHKVLMILVGCGFIDQNEHSDYAITQLGNYLIAVLKTIP